MAGPLGAKSAQTRGRGMRGTAAILMAGLWLGLAACVAGGPKADATKANPITGGEIATTSLDSPAVAPPEPAPAALAPAQTATADNTAPAPAQPQGSLTVKTPPPKADPADLTPEAVACRKKGGTWARAGKAAGKTCLQPTRDAGKSCRRQSDCEGLCLARSRSCAPIKPMFGCNAILQDDGREVTLCID